jgi:hypothetical protein
LSIWPLVRFKYITSFYIFVSFIVLSSIDRPYITIHFVESIKGSLYTKLTEQHDHNMQLKKWKENKTVKIKMKRKNTCASALIQLCNVKFFPNKYALWRQVKRPQSHIYGGCATLCANELGPPSLKQSLILSWLFENVHRWTHVLKATILNVFLSKNHMRDYYAIAEDQFCKFWTFRKRNHIKHTSISRCQPLEIWRPNQIFTNI